MSVPLYSVAWFLMPVAYQDFTLHFHNTQVYRALMLVSLFIAAVAFVLIFVAHSNTNGLVSIVRGQLLV